MNLSPTEVASRLRSASPPHLLDVRQPDEHAFVSLPDSKLIPLGELSARADELEDWKDEEIVVYCHHGVRSLHAISHLHALGFTRLFNLAGGIDRWTSEVQPALPRY